jgi:hypothetical protein
MNSTTLNASSGRLPDPATMMRLIGAEKARRAAETQVGGWKEKRKKCAADIFYWFDKGLHVRSPTDRQAGRHLHQVQALA